MLTPEKQKAIEVLRELQIDCVDPTHTPTEYVTREMAIDAGDRTLAGTVYRQETWERCGCCHNCMFNLMKSDIISSIQREARLEEALVTISKIAEQINPSKSGLKCNHIPKFCECRFTEINNEAQQALLQESK